MTLVTRFRSRIRMIERGGSFVRLTPNPGVRLDFGVVKVRWCRQHGRRCP